MNTVTSESIFVSILIAILVGAINLSKNIRDIEEDTKGGRRTLAILLGSKNAIRFLAALFWHCVYFDRCISGISILALGFS